MAKMFDHGEAKDAKTYGYTMLCSPSGSPHEGIYEYVMLKHQDGLTLREKVDGRF